MKKVILAILLFVTVSFSQDFGKWQNYYSFNFINEAVGTQSEFWAATTGGVFYYNSSDNSYLTMSIVEGLSSNNIETLARDSNGKIWLGTENGIINIYNPETKSVSKIFDIYNSDKTLKSINQIVVEGEIAYIVTDFGISLINTNTFYFSDTYRKFGNFTAETKTHHILKDNDKLIVSTEEGIAILKDGSINPSAPESWESYSVSGRPVYKTVKFGSKFIACTDKGLYEFDGTQWNLFELENTEVKDLVAVENILLILTSNKLYKFDTSLNEISTDINSAVTFNKLLAESENSYLLCTDQGVYKNGSSENVIMPNGPIKNSFLDIDVDKDGNLFVASGIDGNGSGTFHLDKTNWKTYSTTNTPGLVSNDIQKIYCAPDGKTYLMSKGNGFTIYENGSFTSYTSSNTSLEGIQANPDFVVVSDIDTDVNDDAWILTYLSHSRRNISVLRNTGDWHHFQIPSSVFNQTVTTDEIEIDQYNTKWFIADKRLCYFNHQNTFLNTSDDIWNKFSRISDAVNCIAVDDRGELWVGTSKGLRVISQTNNLQSAPIRNVNIEAVFGKNIKAIEVDALNQKWIATDEGIVLLAQDGSRAFEAYNTDNSPLPSNNISSLAFDNTSGLLFIATDEGLLSYQTTAVEPNKEFSELFVYPNPFVIGQSSSGTVKIDGLIKDTDIKILSISGELIREFETPGGRIATWDGKDENGEYVGSGVYVVVAYDREANNVATAKIAVLRK